MRKISIGTFDCTEEDINAVVKALKSGFLSTGTELKTFEECVAIHHDKKHGVMVNSGQSALEVALQAAKYKLGKDNLKVIIPATTYAATLWAIINTGCIPVFCDIGKDYNIDYSLIEDLNADVIMSVDLCGKSAQPNFDAWDKHFIIEDACEAFGNESASYGDLICLSFYVSHIITTGSGGMICTESEELEEWMRSYISHGRQIGGDFTQFKDEWIDRFLFDKIGVSYRSDNMSGALGLSQYARVEEIIQTRKDNAFKLIEEYEKNEALQRFFIFPDRDYHSDCVFQFFPILIRENSINRGKLLSELFNCGIDSRVLLSLTNQSIVKKLYGNIEDKFPFSKYCNENGFIIGCHQNLTISDMEYVIDVLTSKVERR